jgi:uncharacterized repeat protein (TIGR01451 family)
VKKLIASLTSFALFSIASTASSQQVCARPGNDGPLNAGGGTVNSYFAPAAGITIAQNTTATISLANKRGAASALAVGDLVMVIQMQCANINATSSPAYGGNTATGRGYLNGAVVGTTCSAGTYEYLRAGAGSSDTQFVPATAFKNNYTQSAGLTATNNVVSRRTFQVVRIPQYSAVTLGSELTGVAWDGLTGGVIAMDAAGGFNFNGQTINMRGLGFRGGAGQNRPAGDSVAANAAGSADPAILNDYRTAAQVAPLRHASKGEGIAGTPRIVHVDTNPADTAAGVALDLGTLGYPNGDWGKGAPGNAGGGGEDINNSARDNGGGGGGGNAGRGGNGGFGWRGAGWAGFTPAYVNGAGLFAAPLHGLGGEEFAERAPTRVVMGGGGGAGGSNANGAVIDSSGGAGGGIVLVRAQTFSGNGVVDVTGARAPDQPLNDGAGGGGAGGSVVLLSNSGTLAGVTINAGGGRGGDSWLGGNSAHGGGAGGGGGYVVTSSASPGTLAGGAGGLTNTADTPPGGASHGAQGGVGAAAQINTLVGGTIDNSTAPLCKPILTVTKATTTPTRLEGSDTFALYTIGISNAPTAGEAQRVALTDDLPAPFTYTAGANVTVTYAGGATGPATPATGAGTDPFTVGVAGGAPSFTIPGGATVTLQVRVNLNTAISASNPYQNTATTAFLDPTRLGGAPTVSPGGVYASGDTVGGTNYTAASTTNEDVNLLRSVNLSITKTNNASTVTAGGITTYFIDVTNAGPSSANNSLLRDTPSAGLQCTSVTCSVISGSAACPAGPLNINNLLGSGINIPSFASNSTLRFTVQCDVTGTGL